MNILFLCLLSIFALSCLSQQKASRIAQASPSSKNADSISEIKTVADYKNFAQYEGSDQAAVKFVVDLNPNSAGVADPKIYFFNPIKFRVHKAFVKSLPKYQGMNDVMIDQIMGNCLPNCPPAVSVVSGDLHYFENIGLNADAEKRAQSAFLESIYTLPTSIFGVTFRSGESLKQEDLVKLLRVTDAAVTAKTNPLLIFKPFLEGSFENLTVEGLTLYSMGEYMSLHGLGLSENYKVYHEAKSYGYLKRVTADDIRNGNYSSKDIVILDEVPLDIGPIAGVITLQPQTPLSHVMLRSIEQNIPNVYYLQGALFGKDGFFSSALKVEEKIGKLVEFEVYEYGLKSLISEDDVDDKAAFQAAAEAYFRDRRPELPPLNYEKTHKFYQWSDDSDIRNVASQYGAKGSNFAMLDRVLKGEGIDRSRFASSFLSPMAYYGDYLNNNKIDEKNCAAAAKECQKETGLDCTQTEQQCLASQGMSFFGFIKEKIFSEESKTALLADPLARRRSLGFVRGLIEEGKLTDHEDQIVTRARQAFKPNQRIRFRSSTNAEDLPNVNGAGLYVSKAGCLADTDGSIPPILSLSELKLNCQDVRFSQIDFSKRSNCKTNREIERELNMICRFAKDQTLSQGDYDYLIKELLEQKKVAKAIKKVFASVWNDKAFLARDYYGIDHLAVKMGLLVHPSFDDETANGVLVVSSPAKDQFRVQISVQTEDVSITNPELPGAIPETFYVDVDPDGHALAAPYYFSRSNLVANGATVLSQLQLKSLLQQVILIHKGLDLHMPKFFTGTTDIEFKAAIDGSIIMKQIRPLTAN